MIFDFFRGAHESAQRRPRERAANADAPHPGRRHVIDRKRRPFQSHHDIDRFGDGCTDLSDCIKTRQSGSIENVSASLLKEVARLDGDLDGIVSPTVAQAIRTKLGQPHE